MTGSERVLVLLACLSVVGFTGGDRPSTDPRSHDITAAAPTRQGRVGSASTATGATTASLTVTVPAAGVPINRRLIARLTTGSKDGTVSATDSRGNTWSVDAEHRDIQRNIRVVVLSAHIATALTAGNTITVSFPAVYNAALVVDAFTGVQAGDAVVQKAYSSGTSATASSGPLTTATENALLIGFIGTRGTATVNFQAGSGWTAEGPVQAGPRLALPEYRVAAAGGSFQANGALGASTEWAAVVVAYRPPQQIPLPSDPSVADEPTRRAPPTTLTSTDLTLAVAKQVLDGPDAWVDQISLAAPEALTFRWGRPGRRAGTTASSPTRSSLTEKAQWQMVVAATPTQAVVFLPSAEKGPAGLPAYVMYSYGSIPVSLAGSTADFTIPSAKIPTPPPPATIWVRVVLSTSSQLQGSPWVKIAMVKSDDPVEFTDLPPDPTPLWITLSKIQCLRETSDLSPEDEIYVVLAAINLNTATAANRVSVKITGIYHFDQDDASMRTQEPQLRIWGTDRRSLPTPIMQPDAAVVLAQVVEYDGEYNPSSHAPEIQSLLAAKLDTLVKNQLPRAEIIKQLKKAMFDAVYKRLADPTDSDIIGGAGFVAVREDIWQFTAGELENARAGQVVSKELSFEHASSDNIAVGPEIGGDDSWYKLLFEMSKQGVVWE